MSSTKVRNMECSNSEATEEHFILKPFVQTPDAEIPMNGDTSNNLRWHDRWDRKCGNPAVSIINKSH
ncbi:MAG: hypothetical protein JXR78_14105 [Victivallales bacterium]|nr:hypothetical protein [Victivallales bacterium]